MYSKAVRWLGVIYLVPRIVSYDDGEMMAALVVLFSRCSCIGDGLLCIVVVSAIVHLRRLPLLCYFGKLTSCCFCCRLFDSFEDLSEAKFM